MHIGGETHTERRKESAEDKENDGEAMMASGLEVDFAHVVGLHGDGGRGERPMEKAGRRSTGMEQTGIATKSAEPSVIIAISSLDSSPNRSKSGRILIGHVGVLRTLASLSVSVAHDAASSVHFSSRFLFSTTTANCTHVPYSCVNIIFLGAAAFGAS
jgi:hypothetical protein